MIDLLIIIGTFILFISFDHILLKLGILLFVVIYGDIKIRHKTATTPLIIAYGIAGIILILVFLIFMVPFIYI